MQIIGGKNISNRKKKSRKIMYRKLRKRKYHPFKLTVMCPQYNATTLSIAV